MKRLIDYYLLEWKQRPTRKPLLLRGARQVGKTHAVRVLGQTVAHVLSQQQPELRAALQYLVQG